MNLFVVPNSLLLALTGLLIGLVFGAVAQVTNFCTMGAISDVVITGDRRRLRSWLLAIAVAVVSAQALQAGRIVDLSRSPYLGPLFDWAGALGGGLLFGVGMVLAGGCASRNLARAGSGDMRALLTLLVLGVTAFAAIGGVLGPPRAALSSLTAIDLGAYGLRSQGLGAMLSRATGIAGDTASLWAAVGIGLALLFYCLADGGFRKSALHIVAGLVVGACVAAGWAATGLLYDELSLTPVPPASLTFVRPVGDSLDWLMRATAIPIPGFGVASVGGTLLGAWLGARMTGRFRWTTFAGPADTGRHLAGAVLMGLGGVMATGCSIGQGVTGLSTLALGSMLALGGIVAGAVAAIKVLEWRA